MAQLRDVEQVQLRVADLQRELASYRLRGLVNLELEARAQLEVLVWVLGGSQ